MLDRESQIDSTAVQWSTDGNRFIIMDQTQFESVSIVFVMTSFRYLHKAHDILILLYLHSCRTLFRHISTTQSSFLASWISSLDGASVECQVNKLGVLSFVHQLSRDWVISVRHHQLLLRPVSQGRLGGMVLSRFISSKYIHRLRKLWRRPIQIHYQAVMITWQILSQPFSVSVSSNSSPPYQVSSRFWIKIPISLNRIMLLQSVSFKASWVIINSHSSNFSK